MPEITDPIHPVPPRHFGPSRRALAQRRGLLGACLLALLGLGTAGLESAPADLRWGLGLGLVALAWVLWRAGDALLLGPLRQRQLLLHDQALELRRGAFTRFVVYEALRHIKVVQGPGERLLSLTLDLDDDSVVLRDLEGLPEAFAAVAGAKPDGAVIEIDERRIDWGEPLPWALLALAAAVGLRLLV